MTPEEIRYVADGDIEPKIARLLRCNADTIEHLQQQVEKLQTWDGLMGTLNKLYPEDVVPTLPDSELRDPGARIVSLVRQVEKLRADAEQWNRNLELLVAELSDPMRWNWTNAIGSSRDAADCVLRTMSQLDLVEIRQHPLGGYVYRCNGNMYGRTDGLENFDAARH